MKKFATTIFVLVLLPIFAFANDLQPVHVFPNIINPYMVGDTISVNLDVRFNCNYPVNSGECGIEIIIKDSNDIEKYRHYISGVSGNGPTTVPVGQCDYSKPVDKLYLAENFLPTKAGTYFITVIVYYNYDINESNNTYEGTFIVDPLPTKDLSIIKIISPSAENEYYKGNPIELKLRIKNNGTITASASDWKINIEMRNNEIVTKLQILGQNISPGQELEVTDTFVLTENEEHAFSFVIEYNDDINPEDNTKDTAIYVYGPPNQIAPSDIFFPREGMQNVPVKDPLEFSWENGKAPVKSQEFELSVDNEIVYDEDLLTTDASSLTLPLGVLDFGTTYKWTLKQTNPAGTTENGPFTFTTEEEHAPRDLAITEILSPSLNENYYLKKKIPLILKVKNLSEVTIFANEWQIDVGVDKSDLSNIYKVSVPGQEILSGEEITITIDPTQSFIPLKSQLGDDRSLLFGFSINSPSGGTYQDDNIENNVKNIIINLKSNDLALTQLISPAPESWFWAESAVWFTAKVKNTGEVPVSEGAWEIYFHAYNDNDDFEYYLLGDALAPGEEKIFTATEQFIPKDNGQDSKYTMDVTIKYDDDIDNNNGLLTEFSVLSGKAWVNEIHLGEGKSGKIPRVSASTNPFVEVIVRQNISDFDKYKATIYDNTGHIVSQNYFSEFTAGEVVDSFAIYTMSFAENQIPFENGGVALSVSGSPIPGSFISWGGKITAAEGDWQDSTSSNIGIIPLPDSSIALVGSGTDFGKFKWQIAVPTPGSLNPSEDLTTVVNEMFELLPDFQLDQNYPNPFNSSTVISYEIPFISNVELKIYDIYGKKIATLVDEKQDVGNYKVEFNATGLPMGIYFYELRAGKYTETKKMIFNEVLNKE